jgi:hypothetical protein
VSEGHAYACRQASDYRLLVLREDQTHGTRAHLPRLAGPVAGIVKRLSDPLPVVRDRLYNPGFEFSNSIKSAATALCPDVTYGDLDEIADGASASTAFWQMASGRIDEKTSVSLRRSPLAYCHRDTWALVRLHQALNMLAVDSN